ncbi:MAG: hypothetical protein LC808_35105 [Actinobacteria bacterium]|nr:hypothetical protein [Actinomycetota bacterium]
MAQSWTAWLKIAHAALAIVLACYLVMVAVNSFLFRYNFWNDPPPTGRADLFAVVSLWALFLVASFIGAVAYSWMCEFASDPTDGLRSPLRRAARATLRKWWIAAPGFALTMLACVFYFPGITAVALLGPLPLQQGGTVLRDQFESRVKHLELWRGVGAVVALVVASTVWVAGLVGSSLVSNFDGPVEAVAPLLAYLSYLCSALVAGWAASSFASPPTTRSEVG